jgi:TonB family protein
MVVGASPAQRATRIAQSSLLDRVVRWSRPTYPPGAAPGEVGVQFVIDRDGALLEARAVSGPEPLRPAAEHAARTWQFRRAAGDEMKGPVGAVLTFEFVEEIGVAYGTLKRTLDSKTKDPFPPATPLDGTAVPLVGTAKSLPSARRASATPGRRVAKKLRIRNNPRPNYTDQAWLNHTEGVVRVKALFAADGTIEQALVMEGLPDGLSLEAVEAVRKIEFDPGVDDAGDMIDMWMVIQVNFTVK